MKKAILSIIVMMTLGASFSIAQSNNFLASNVSDHDINYNDHYTNSLDGANYSVATTSKRYDIPESATNLQMNSTTGLLNIAVKSDIKYTKIELFDKKSNTTIQTLEISGSKESVDLSEVDPGTYYMILSNKKGDILSEKLIII